MKKLLLALVLTGSAFSTQAQYNRSLFYQDGGSSVYRSAMIPEGENLRVFNCGGSEEDTLRLSWTTINELGDVTESHEITLPDPGVGATTYLSGAFEESAGVYLIALLTIDGANQGPAYLRVNTTTQQIVNTYFADKNFKMGFCGTIQNGSELVMALIHATDGLSRISFSPATFSSIATEVINAASLSAVNSATGRKLSEIVLFGGVEHIIVGASGSATLYKKTAPLTWSSLIVNNSDGRQIDLVLNDNNQLVAFAGTSYAIVDNNFTSVSSGTLTGPAIFGNSPSECIFRGDRYFRMTTSTAPSFSSILEYDNTFSLVNEVSTPNSTRFDKALVYNDDVYLMGDCNNSGFNHTTGAEGDVIDVGRVSFFVRTNDLSQFTSFTEYGQPFQQNAVSFHLGQGNVYFSARNGNLPSAQYNDSISLAFYAAGLFSGKTTADEVVGLDPDGYFESDMLAGPYTNPADYSLVQNAKYNRGFYVTRQMIEAHFDSLVSGSATYIAPHGIREWPAHGTISIGQAADIAPFWDRNSDGVYDPYAGDYPKIYGDQCFFTISHQNSARDVSANVELHTYFYAYDCSDDTAYHNTLFIKQHYLPKAFALDSFYVGSYLDMDLGNPMDDYNGTHAGLGLVYGYNGDLQDEPYGGRPGFETDIPAEGFMILRGSKVADDATDNTSGVGPNQSVNGYGFGDGTADNEYYGLESSFMFTGAGGATIYGEPSNLDQLTNMLHGYYRFGDIHYYGGPGPGATTIQTKYDFPGDSDMLHYGTNGADPGFAWSEYEPAGPGSISNPPGDRRMMASTGKSALEVGDTLTYELVYLCAMDSAAATINDPLDKLFELAATIKANFEVQSGPCGIDFGYTVVDSDLGTATTLKDPFILYPNPTNGLIAISGMGADSYLVTVYDVNGRLLESHEMNSQHNQLSLEAYSGSLFLVHIINGSQTVVKRIVKQ